MSGLTRKISLALVASAVLATAANAGGFGRGTADTDILYDDAAFNVRAGALYVAPQRGYETIGGAPAAPPGATRP